MTSSHIDLATGQASQALGGPGWLAGLRVLAVGSSASVRVAASVLGGFGANVRVKADSVVSAREVPGNTDIVLVDRIGSSVDVALGAAEYVEFVESANNSVWVTATTFGVQSTRADAVGSELIALAAGGVLGHSRDGRDSVPVLPAGEIGLNLVGICMAMAALHALHDFRRVGTPVHVDLSAQAAVIASGLCLEMAHALGGCRDEGGSSRYGAPTGFFQCVDGRVYLVVLEQHQWTALRDCLRPALDEIDSIEDARLRSAEVNEAVATWAALRTRVECEQRLQDAGVPCTAVNEIPDFRRRSLESGRVTLADPQAMPGDLTQGQRREKAARDTAPIPLSDLRVLDAGHVLAVPLATSWLGAMGAQVTKAEDPSRLDVYRRRGPFVAGVPGLNRSAYFNQVNYCKQGMDFNADSEGSSLSLDGFDVIIQNLSPRRARTAGVDGATVLTGSQSNKLVVTSSGFGTTGDWANYRAYGHNIHAFSGLIAASRNADGEMADVGTPWADPLAGAAIATWVLAWSLSESRDRSSAVDMSMAELLAAQLSPLEGVDPHEYYGAPSVGGDFFVRAGDGAGFVAVTLTTRVDVETFESLTGVPFVSPERRGGVLDDSALGALQHVIGDLVAERLRGGGLAAAAVQTARELAGDQFVRSTGLFQEVRSADLGSYEVTGLPWSYVGHEREPLTAAPEK